MKLSKLQKYYKKFFNTWNCRFSNNIRLNYIYKRQKKGTKLFKKITKSTMTLSTFYKDGNPYINVNCNTNLTNMGFNFCTTIQGISVFIVLSSERKNSAIYIGGTDDFEILFGNDDYTVYNLCNDSFTNRTKFIVPELVLDFDNLTEEQMFQSSTVIDNLELYKEVRSVLKELVQIKDLTPMKIHLYLKEKNYYV